MLTRAVDVHGYATRSARGGLALMTRDHRSIGYRAPKEWASMSEAQREVRSLAAFKRGSRGQFVADYGAFVCCVLGRGVCQFRPR